MPVLTFNLDLLPYVTTTIASAASNFRDLSPVKLSKIGIDCTFNTAIPLSLLTGDVCENEPEVTRTMTTNFEDWFSLKGPSIHVFDVDTVDALVEQIEERTKTYLEELEYWSEVTCSWNKLASLSSLLVPIGSQSVRPSTRSASITSVHSATPSGPSATPQVRGYVSAGTERVKHRSSEENIANRALKEYFSVWPGYATRIVSVDRIFHSTLMSEYQSVRASLGEPGKEVMCVYTPFYTEHSATNIQRVNTSAKRESEASSEESVNIRQWCDSNLSFLPSIKKKDPPSSLPTHVDLENRKLSDLIRWGIRVPSYKGYCGEALYFRSQALPREHRAYKAMLEFQGGKPFQMLLCAVAVGNALRAGADAVVSSDWYDIVQRKGMDSALFFKRDRAYNFGTEAFREVCVYRKEQCLPYLLVSFLIDEKGEEESSTLCELHREELQHYCVQCSSLCCDKCISFDHISPYNGKSNPLNISDLWGQHAGHSLQPASAVDRQKRFILSEMLRVLQKTIQTHYDVIADVPRRVSMAEEECQNMISDIDETASQLHGLVKAIQGSSIEFVKGITAEKKRLIAEEEKDTREIADTLLSKKQPVLDALAITHTKELLAASDNVVQLLRSPPSYDASAS